MSMGATRFALLCALSLAFITGAHASTMPTTHQTSKATTKKVNFVMLFVDDLGYGDVGFTGHPSTRTPNIDKLAYGGKVLTNWYSGCNVCSGSRGALMTGRQFTRIGIPGVFSPTVNVGLPLNETTVAEHLKGEGNYNTAIVGKWHLGQREVYLPGNRGFDEYLGIPYSDDMGEARATPCPKERHARALDARGESTGVDPVESALEMYVEGGFVLPEEAAAFHAARNGHRHHHGKKGGDPAGKFLPLVYQNRSAPGVPNATTQVLEQPLDFTALALKYRAFATDFIQRSAAAYKAGGDPFFLYAPFSHVHTTASNQPDEQYAGCAFKNSTKRGPFGDALAEADWLVGEIVAAIEAAGVAEDTLILFTGDNGPWMVKGESGGSTGLLYGRNAGYWNVGKGSNWEGGIREAAFAYWPGTIEPNTRSDEVVSSMDVFPTLSKLAGLELPPDRVYDGADMSDVLLAADGKSKHEALFFYHPGVSASSFGPTAVRYKQYKAHWMTKPGLGGCDEFNNPDTKCATKWYPDPPLLFDVQADPSEAYPLTQNGTRPSDPAIAAVVSAIKAARKAERARFTTQKLIPPPDGPGEGPNKYGVCCSRAKGCDCDGPPSAALSEADKPVDRCAAAIEAACPHAHARHSHNAAATAPDQCVACAWDHHEALEAEAACGGRAQLKGHVMRACGATEADLLRVGKRLSDVAPLTSCQSIAHCDDCYTHTVAFVHTCFWGTGAGCTGAGGIQCWTVGNGPGSCDDSCCVSDSDLSGCLYGTEGSCSTLNCTA